MTGRYACSWSKITLCCRRNIATINRQPTFLIVDEARNAREANILRLIADGNQNAQKLAI